MMMDMMDTTGMWIGMVVGMGVIWLLVIAFLALGIGRSSSISAPEPNFGCHSE
jgi:hypothetical protein